MNLIYKCCTVRRAGLFLDFFFKELNLNSLLKNFLLSFFKQDTTSVLHQKCTNPNTTTSETGNPSLYNRENMTHKNTLSHKSKNRNQQKHETLMITWHKK